MQKIIVICVGKLREKFYRDACDEYVKRLHGFCKFEEFEIGEVKLPPKPSVSQILDGLEKEGGKIIAKIPKGSSVISLCVEGTQLTSEQLAFKIGNTRLQSEGILTFIVGSSFGLCDKVKNMSREKLSLSKMTFPHQLARVMLFEQIYRACGILSNSDYHK